LCFPPFFGSELALPGNVNQARWSNSSIACVAYLQEISSFRELRPSPCFDQPRFKEFSGPSAFHLGTFPMVVLWSFLCPYGPSDVVAALPVLFPFLPSS